MAIEWVGVVLVVVLIGLALANAAPRIGDRIGCEISRQIDDLRGAPSAACSGATTRTRPSSPVARRTPFGAPDVPRGVPRSPSPRRGSPGPRRTAPNPSRPGRSRPDGLGRDPRVQRVALPAAVPAAIGAVVTACKIGKKACVKAIKTACKIPLAGGLCKRVKKLGCKLAKVYCPKKRPRRPPRYPKASGRADNAFRTGTERFLVEGGGRIKLYGNDGLGRARRAHGRAGPKVRAAYRGKANRSKGSVPKAQQLKSVKPECRKFFQKGHVLSRALGGPGNDLRNLMPVTAAFNAKTLKRAEKQILAIADRTGVSVRVAPNYRPGEVVPRSVTYVAEGDDGTRFRKTVRQSFRGIPSDCLTA